MPIGLVSHAATGKIYWRLDLSALRAEADPPVSLRGYVHPLTSAKLCVYMYIYILRYDIYCIRHPKTQKLNWCTGLNAAHL